MFHGTKLDSSCVYCHIYVFQDQVKYRLVGDDVTLLYFDIDENSGQIVLSSSILQKTELDYTVSDAIVFIQILMSDFAHDLITNEIKFK